MKGKINGPTTKQTGSPLKDEDLKVWILLDHARFAIARARELELAQYGITPEHAAVLYTLLDKGGSATMHEISNITMRQHNSTSTLIKRMLKQGLVGKEKMSTGKRYKISITKKGQSIYEKVTRISINMAFSALSPKEKQRLAACLRQLIDKGRDMLGLDQTFPFLPSRLAD